MTKAKWESINIHNAHQLVSLYERETGAARTVYIDYSSNDGSRMDMGVLSGYYVAGLGFKTDPEGHWTNYGKKAFYASRLGYPGALAEAIAWAQEQYKVGEFAQITGMGRDWFPVEVADWAKAYIKTVAAPNPNKVYGMSSWGGGGSVAVAAKSAAAAMRLLDVRPADFNHRGGEWSGVEGTEVILANPGVVYAREDRHSEWEAQS